MKTGGTLATVAAVWALLALAPAATADAGDSQASLAYLRAYHTLLEEYRVGLAAAVGATNAYVKQVTAECPSVMTGAPHGAQFESLSSEIVGAVTVVLSRSFGGPAHKFIRNTRHLRWSSAKLTKLVRAANASESASALLEPPDLCADMKQWLAGGSRQLPAGTKRFEREIHASQGPEASQILAVIDRGASPAVRARVGAAKMLEGHILIAILAAIVQPVRHLEEAVGMRSPTLTPG